MRCKNSLCIYQKEDDCLIASELSIDAWGHCENYFSIWLEQDTLRKEKRRLLVDYESEEFANKVYPLYNGGSTSPCVLHTFFVSIKNKQLKQYTCKSQASFQLFYVYVLLFFSVCDTCSRILFAKFLTGKSKTYLFS